VDDENGEITDVLFKGRFHEWWRRKKERRRHDGLPLQNISHGHMYIINNNRALFIARYVLLVVKQEI